MHPTHRLISTQVLNDDMRVKYDAYWSRVKRRAAREKRRAQKRKEEEERQARMKRDEARKKKDKEDEYLSLIHI